MLAKVKAYFSTPGFNTFRAMLYVALPAWLLELAREGKLSQDHANLWVAVALAASGPALAAIFAPGGWRTYMFTLAVPVQAALVGIGGLSHNAFGLLVIALLNAVAISGVSAANVHNAETTGAPPDTTPPR